MMETATIVVESSLEYHHVQPSLGPGRTRWNVGVRRFRGSWNMTVNQRRWKQQLFGVWQSSQESTMSKSSSTLCEATFQDSADGPKTVFFWAPVMKWGLVCAGMADMTRPAEKLSTAQSAVLTATGLIWSRYSLVIIPKNWGLFTVNFFVGCAGGSQLFRIWRYNQELKAKEKEQLQQKEP
ncbi:mitochondrial pyruvate carrier 2 isoform X1 [Mauremys reevesii]|uniref:mitochondrial pyruvate carrier 2 isoform X1 n=1 Tax=Mauremys reevesii TaxID=260615 RepID=UPI00193FB018|nr:mitochondrial pyruvate carrier 2 isoform X1 [Mauremys reevesii]